MIDKRYSNCRAINRLNNAFKRSEKNNYTLYIPYGWDLNNPLIINNIGEKILLMSKNKFTIQEMANQIHKENPEVDISVIFNDIFSFLEKVVELNMIEIEGMETMKNKEFIFENSEYSILHCNEGDLRLILNMIESKNKQLDIIDASLPENYYTALMLRTRLFNLSEEFYILKGKNPIFLLGILSGTLFKNNIPIVSRYIKLNDTNNDFEIDFLSKSVFHYLDNYSERKVLRLQIEVENNELFLTEITKLRKVGFREIAMFKNELGKSRDVIIYDYESACQ